MGISGGGAVCWGSNDWSQLGDGTATRRSTPVDVVGLESRVTAVAAGNSHTCALTAGGGVVGWGANSAGQLGDGTARQRRTPVEAVGLGSGVTAIAAGGYHTCAITTGGGVKCWGQNQHGQLGNGAAIQHTTPVVVAGFAMHLPLVRG